MNKPSHVCSKCKRSFRRRWNAQRHNDTIHKGLSNITIKYKSGDGVNPLKNKPDRHHPSFADATKSNKFIQMSQNNAKDYSFRSLTNDGSPLKKPNKTVVTMDEGEKEDFIDVTSEKMAIHLEKLEKLFFEKLYPHEPHEKIIKMLCSIVIAALAMPDPIRFMQDKITYCNRQYYSAKMIGYVAKSYGIDAIHATECLKNVLLARYLYE